jgi:hypothetical protein
MVEPWLRGTLTEIDAVRRQMLHALELAREDIELWCSGLSDDEMNARPFGMASVAFHLRHVTRSLDRLLTYAEGGALSTEQMAALQGEMEGDAMAGMVLQEMREGIAEAERRVKLILP